MMYNLFHPVCKTVPLLSDRSWVQLLLPNRRRSRITIFEKCLNQGSIFGWLQRQVLNLQYESLAHWYLIAVYGFSKINQVQGFHEITVLQLIPAHHQTPWIVVSHSMRCEEWALTPWFGKENSPTPHWRSQYKVLGTWVVTRTQTDQCNGQAVTPATVVKKAGWILKRTKSACHKISVKLDRHYDIRTDPKTLQST